jgi:ethanolamine-phosphate cytidylyltransferase
MASLDSVPDHWPVDPQEDVPISEGRIWIDGCFDFAHHGHAGASLQARRLGKELLVGIHSDEAILENKGPTVMNLAERVAAVDACRWVTKSVPHAPYVTSLAWISHYGCKYVGHGDDITSDSSGEDCYRFVKAASRFKVFKRTPGISTTDLVGRMLLCTRSHFIKSLEAVLAGKEGPGNDEERARVGKEMFQRIRDYATDESGFHTSSEVWSWTPVDSIAYQHEGNVEDDAGSFKKMVVGKPPQRGQRVVYVDGGFDLFSSGHIEFLRRVLEVEEQRGRNQGWFTKEAGAKRLKESGEDYGPAYVVAGVHDDLVINYFKGVNYPIMNIFERGLCALQCRVSRASAEMTVCLLTDKVHPLRNILCPFRPNSCISSQPTIWTTRPGISRTHSIHASSARPI